MLTRSGYITSRDKLIERELTVTPEVNTDYAPRGIPFKVFKRNKDSLCIPQHYGMSRVDPNPEDKRPEPLKVPIPFSGTLKKEIRQDEAVRNVMDSMKKHRGAVLTLPTGYGKTTCALKIASLLGYRTLILVHKEFLANQWKERIGFFCPGCSVGRIQQNKFDIEHPFVVGMLQTFVSRGFEVESFESFGLVIVDESHHICAKVFSQAMLRMCPKYTLGLTATPERKDGLTDILYWFLGPSAFYIKRETEEAAELDAFHPKLKIYETPFPVGRFGKVSMAEAITVLTADEERNGIILEKVNEYPDRKILLLTDRREHCNWLRDNIPGSSLYIGGMKEKDLEESSKSRIIVGTYNMAQEGLDIGDVDTVFLTTPKSDIVQAIGRCMREGGKRKNNSLIIDLHDKWGPFDAMYYKRRKTYKELGMVKEKPKEKLVFKRIETLKDLD